MKHGESRLPVLISVGVAAARAAAPIFDFKSHYWHICVYVCMCAREQCVGTELFTKAKCDVKIGFLFNFFSVVHLIFYPL